MAGKRLTIRGRDLSWKEGRPKIRRSRQTPPPPPNLTLDLAVAAVASVVAGAVAFCLAFILFGSHKVPLYLGYAVIMGGVGFVCFVMGPKERGSRMVAGGIGLLCLIGSAGLFSVRADIVIHPHRHKRDAGRGLGYDQPHRKFLSEAVPEPRTICAEIGAPLKNADQPEAGVGLLHLPLQLPTHSHDDQDNPGDEGRHR